MNRGREILVGLIFLAAIIILGIFTIIVSDFNPFRSEVSWQVTFDDVRGLKKGNEVRVAGVNVGRVKDIELKKGQVLVKLGLYEELPFYENGTISIESVTPLGGKFVNIDVGDPASRKIDPTKTAVHGEPSPEDITTALNKLVKDIREGSGTIPRLLRDDDVYVDIKNITGSIGDFAKDIREGKGLIGKISGPDGDKIYADVQAIVVSVRDAAEQIAQKKGTLGKIIYDEALYDQLDSAAVSVRTIAGDLQAGKGTIGKLLTDQKLYDDIAKITEQVKSGDGVVGRLVNDPEMGKDLKAVIERLSAVASSIEKGEGTIGALVKDRKLYDDAAELVASLKEAARKMSTTEGTVGKLINDPTLYAKIERLVTELTEAAEDAREAAPITAFSTVLLAGFR